MTRQGPTAGASSRKGRKAGAEVEAKSAAGSRGVEPAAAGGIGSYADALANLHQRIDMERERRAGAVRHAYKLDRMRALAQALGNPQDSIRAVHVAGTKGKGSTCEMAATCLEACGYAVGLYTSPHLTDIRERIRLSRKPVSQAAFTALTRSVAKAADKVAAKHGQATFFEMMTAMALVHFAEQAVDAAVIEVGLGGQLDCTNIITPEVAAVTTIGLDHTDILGKSIEEIAQQKAGIFKPGVPALTVAQAPAVLKVLREHAQKVGAPFFVIGEDIDFSFRFEWQAGVGPVARVSLTTERSNYEHIAVPLKGEHQAFNCGLSLAILDKLSERGFACPEAKVTRGLDLVSLPGRFELIPGSPRLLLDVAHNPDSIKALMKAIGAYVQYDSMITIFGCAQDKDAQGILRNLAMGADKVIFTRASGNSRAAKPQDLQRKYAEISGKSAQVAATLAEAIDLARRGAGRDDLVCITGSFYLVGEAKKMLAELGEKAVKSPSRAAARR